jgi:calcineurin-like phosphoesterase family protein
MVIGNHDIKNVINQYKFEIDGNERIVWNGEYLVEIFDENKKKVTTFTVSHHPYMSFNGAFNLHGHLHTPPDLQYYTGSDKVIGEKLREMGNYYDVGVDGNGYKPVRLSDILTGNTISPKMKCVDYEFWQNKLIKK